MLETIRISMVNPGTGCIVHRNVKNRCAGNDAPYRALHGNGFRSQGINRRYPADALHGRHHGCSLLQAHSRLEDCGKALANSLIRLSRSTFC